MSVFPARYRGLVAAGLLAIAAAAHSHSATETTVPADGATLDTSPDEIRVRFDQPLRVTLLRLTDDDGNTHDVAYDRGQATKTLIAQPASLPSGAYTVEWRGLSADGHSASGTFSFRVE